MGEFSESLELVGEEQGTPGPFSVLVKGDSRGSHLNQDLRGGSQPCKEEPDECHSLDGEVPLARLHR